MGFFSLGPGNRIMMLVFIMMIDFSKHLVVFFLLNHLLIYL